MKAEDSEAEEEDDFESDGDEEIKEIDIKVKKR